MRLSPIDSDRGPMIYHMLCSAIAFGLCIGGIVAPIMIGFSYLAMLLTAALGAIVWAPIALVAGLIVYFFGFFIAVSIAEMARLPLEVYLQKHLVGAADRFITLRDKIRVHTDTLRARYRAKRPLITPAA